MPETPPKYFEKTADGYKANPSIASAKAEHVKGQLNTIISEGGEISFDMSAVGELGEGISLQFILAAEELRRNGGAMHMTKMQDKAYDGISEFQSFLSAGPQKGPAR